MLAEKAIETLKGGVADKFIADVLGIEKDRIEEYKARAAGAIENFCALYGAERDISVFSVGGRSEISGNHTDHNGGRVIAAAVNLDIIAVASMNNDGVVRVKSEGFDEDIVPLDTTGAPREERFFKSDALIAGVAHALNARGYTLGGFDAYTTSNVIKGSGLSSSAAFEVMIGKIFSSFYCGGNVDTKEIAKSAQYAENVYFGKPCGLMDQMGCAEGGLITIDFSSPDPDVRKVDFDFSKSGLSLCITNTGSSHVDLNDDYASVPAEMKQIASHFGAKTLSCVDEEDVADNIPALREKFGDRAVMRALHFYEENKRVGRQVASLEAGDTDEFLRLVRESGKSSFSYLQNVWSTADVRSQGTSVALCLSDRFLAGRRGAARIQGGGFAGTIEAFIPTEDAAEYKKMMEKVFGEGSCHILFIRPSGAVKII
ncbi:MAG: galactokinase [Clostridia bacterium]|nr:galactokinase [Clostridia bacterium]